MTNIFIIILHSFSLKLTFSLEFALEFHHPVLFMVNAQPNIAEILAVNDQPPNPLTAIDEILF
jgi:hypothetical protein